MCSSCQIIMSFETFNTLIGIGIIAISLVTVALVIFRFVIGKNNSIMQAVRTYALPIGFVLGLSSIVGSLTYSNIYMLPPCLFCWWQRIFLYPQFVLFAVAWYRNHKKTFDGKEIFYFTTPLAVISSLVSLYHVFLQQGVIASKGACLQNGVSCTTIDISIFGFLTIPMMALVLGVALVLLGITVMTSNKKTA